MLTHFIIRPKQEYAEFFVNTFETKPTQFSATWCAYTSYGVFGHHWSSMGEPFEKFIAGIDADYLLGKIGRKVFDQHVMKASLLSSIQDQVDAGSVTHEQANEATEYVHRTCDEFEGAVLCKEIYESSVLHKCGIDLCEITTQKWNIEAQQFTNYIWPAFVEEYARQMKCP